MKMQNDDDLFTGGEVTETADRPERQIVVTPQAGEFKLPSWVPVAAVLLAIFLLARKK